MLFLRDEEEEQLRTSCQRLHVVPQRRGGVTAEDFLKGLHVVPQRRGGGAAEDFLKGLHVVPQRRGGGTAEDFLSATPCCSSETRRRSS
ncbi:Myosin light chain 3 skeletal muscle isoform [Dissostichus eleginoides]|uniref:Myosin light chain 3 skeletal muscle isoform n=1 Tax=Dissostichus eleginoides TaxID=100907 RepID=A0AAD9CHF3_DISEL|nr:Myosin light chain 3 skeletal muscle isoform [Dissostichus eleginoides]